jgi:hypothetical protein
LGGYGFALPALNHCSLSVQLQLNLAQSSLFSNYTVQKKQNKTKLVNAEFEKKGTMKLESFLP